MDFQGAAANLVIKFGKLRETFLKTNSPNWCSGGKDLLTNISHNATPTSTRWNVTAASSLTQSLYIIVSAAPTPELQKTLYNIIQPSQFEQYSSGRVHNTVVEFNHQYDAI